MINLHQLPLFYLMSLTLANCVDLLAEVGRSVELDQVREQTFVLFCQNVQVVI